MNWNVRVFSLCVWREARGEGAAGMRAVAWVIRNRALAEKKREAAICCGHLQFSSMTHLCDPQTIVFPEDDDPQWLEAGEICQKIVDGLDTADPTGGALYYANLAHVTSGWFKENIVLNTKEHPQRCTVGKQSFFA